MQLDPKVNKGKPLLVISLDFELHWGVFDKVSPEEKRADFERTKVVIPRILEVFERYGVAATWATVGMLLTESREEWEHYKPAELPTYQNPQLSPYHWVAQNGYDSAIHSAYPLVKQLLLTPGQELGSHTFSHYYTGEPGQQIEQFRADLKASRAIVQDKCGKALQSLVFPRNQFDHQSLKICHEEGFATVRVNPSDWFWKEPVKAGLLDKVFRTGDAVFPLGRHTTFAQDKLLQTEGLPLQLPASRLLRPLGNYSLMNSARIRRIIGEMTFAAKHGLVYHLWWHPHNFGHAPKESMRDLQRLLEVFKKLQQDYGMCSVNMGKLAKEAKAN
ncbi:polysaccharide deacetylase family protein [Echinicola vietnamensis]|uniref:Putative xylanase/chitin deacetylase n=1 Tax=Echinicola vietnamensis (strain DSM 17526 / LMG 23754 / KMM 6221) TaxID=926556 RepID=L0G1G3_ECHVK|nr:polysaccharide deacetylase family protein [Echinicola vietnamensis]AGA78851.1 putative xylanase/chitin deacetylase [Echinicola vietnamensis DSM 17526]